MKRYLLCLLALAVFFGTQNPAWGHEQSETVNPDSLIQDDCREVFAFPEVPYHQAQRFVPDDEAYVLLNVGSQEDPVARLLITTRYCKRVTVAGTTLSNVIDSYIVVSLAAPPRRPDHPSYFYPGLRNDGFREQSVLVEVEGYLLQWVTSHEEQARWLRQAVGLAQKVKHVPGLVFCFNVVPGCVPGASTLNFFFSAPAPAPSPFQLSATVAEPSPVNWDPAVNYWAVVNDDTVNNRTLKIHGEHFTADNQFGFADGTIRSNDNESPLGTMFGSMQTRPINDELLKALSTGYYGRAQWTKHIL